MSRKKWKRLAVVVLPFLGAFVINPALLGGCGATFDYGEPELVAVIETVNRTQQFTFEHKGARYELTVSIVQVQGADKLSALPDLTRSAHACGQRTFMRSAGACIDETTVPLKGSLTLKRIAENTDVLLDAVEVEGRLMAFGTSLGTVHIELGSGPRQVTFESADAKTFKLQRVDLGDASDLHYAAN